MNIDPKILLKYQGSEFSNNNWKIEYIEIKSCLSWGDKFGLLLGINIIHHINIQNMIMS